MCRHFYHITLACLRLVIMLECCYSHYCLYYVFIFGYGFGDIQFNSPSSFYYFDITVNLYPLFPVLLQLSLDIYIYIYNMYVELLFSFLFAHFLISLTSFLYTQTCLVHIRWRGCPISRSNRSRRGRIRERSWIEER